MKVFHKIFKKKIPYIIQNYLKLLEVSILKKNFYKLYLFQFLRKILKQYKEQSFLLENGQFKIKKAKMG